MISEIFTDLVLIIIVIYRKKYELLINLNLYVDWYVNYLKIIWKLFENYLKIIWKLFENYLKIIWKLFENYLKIICKLV